MKKTFTLLLLLFGLGSYGQPTITSSWVPNIGDVIQNAVGANTEAIDPGDSGANVNWDFSNVLKDETVPTGIFEYADPSESSFADLFPDANFAVIVKDIDPDSFPTTFYSVSNDKFELLGNAFPLVSYIYSDPEVFMQFPFSYGDSFEDDYVATSETNGLMSFVRGSVVVTADAYGTISTPHATFSDVIRVKYATYRVDSIAFGPGSYNLVEQNIVNYIWLKNTFGNSIASLSISNGTTTTVAGGMTFTDDLEEYRSFSWNEEDIVQLTQNMEGKLPLTIETYGPNPTNGFFNITLRSECDCNITIQVINQLGQKLKTRMYDLRYGNNALDIDISNIPVGNYIVKLIHEDGYGIFDIRKI